MNLSYCTVQYVLGNVSKTQFIVVLYVYYTECSYKLELQSYISRHVLNITCLYQLLFDCKHTLASNMLVNTCHCCKVHDLKLCN